MKDIEVKKEIEDVDDVELDGIPELAKLLEEVKREEVDDDDNEQLSNVEDILKNLSNNESSDSADDADIQKLQDLLKEKKKELEETDEMVQSKSHSSSTREQSCSLEKKKHERKRKFKTATGNNHQEKKRRENSCQNDTPTNDEHLSQQNQNTSVTPANDEDLSQQNQNPPATPTNEESQNTPVTPTNEESQNTPVTSTNDQEEDVAISVKMERLPTEEELERLLQSTDHSDEEPCGSNSITKVESAEQEVNVSTSPIPVNYDDVNPSNEFYNFCNEDPSNGLQVPQEEEELECLPVLNSAGFSGMPTFKRIKLERPISDQDKENVDTTEETPRDKRQHIFSTCMSLLERLEFSEKSGKFIFIPTITKSDSSAVSNSILQKTSNVYYGFQSIGPKSNLSDWGLKAIGGANGKIAKAIGISADVYFAKIKEKSDTIAAKLIKVETDGHEEAHEMQIENEEPNLSTFSKSSATQTDPLMCKVCVARNRIVGHDIGVQAKAYASSFGTQTYSTGNIHSEMSAGLSEKQLKALYKFSTLIRETSVNPSVEMFQARAMDIFKIIESGSNAHSSSYLGPSRDSSRERPDLRRPHPPSDSSYSPQRQPPVQMLYGRERTTHRPVPSVSAPHSGDMPPAHMAPVHMQGHGQPVHMSPSYAPQPHTPPSHVPPHQSFHSPSHTISHPLPHTMPHPSSRDPRQSRNPSPPQAYWNPPPEEQYPNYHTRGMPGPSDQPTNGHFPSHQGPPAMNYGYPLAAKNKRASYGRGHRL